MIFSTILNQFNLLTPPDTAAVDEAVADTIATAATEAEKASLSERAINAIDFEQLVHNFVSSAVDLGIRILIAVFIFYIGRLIINRIHHVVRNLMIKRDFDRSLASFVLSVIKITLLFILIVIVVSILGIETSSFIALFASAGVAVGMALSGTLQNFAGGVLILFIKPYKVGDFVEFGGYTGTVKEIQIFSTIINTIDNKSIIIPNGQLSTGTINNYSSEDYRRVEWNIAISYGDSIDTAREVALDILTSDDRIVKKYREDDRKKRHLGEPDKQSKSDQESEKTSKRNKPTWLERVFVRRRELKKRKAEWKESRRQAIEKKITKVDCSPTVNVGELAESSVNLVIRGWTRSEFYWSVFFDVNEQIYKRFPEAGLNFPFPQLSVHMPCDSEEKAE